MHHAIKFNNLKPLKVNFDKKIPFKGLFLIVFFKYGQALWKNKCGLLLSYNSINNTKMVTHLVRSIT